MLEIADAPQARVMWQVSPLRNPRRSTTSVYAFQLVGSSRQDFQGLEK
jgi:hypothetical protein